MMRDDAVLIAVSIVPIVVGLIALGAFLLSAAARCEERQ